MEGMNPYGACCYKKINNDEGPNLIFFFFFLLKANHGVLHVSDTTVICQRQQLFYLIKEWHTYEKNHIYIYI